MPSAWFLPFTPENHFHPEPTPDTLVEVNGMVLNALKSAAPLTVLFLAATFSTADVGTAAPQLEALVAKLDADDPIEREAAGEAIRKSDADLKSLFEIMKRPSLSLEQRKRLEAVAREPFENAPRAGLGVSFDRAVDDGSVRIIGTVNRPGFHAHEVLKPGDTVRELDGLPVHSQEQARSVILSHDPGDSIEILVVRQGARIRSSIKLGNFTDLDIGGPINQLRQDFRGRNLDAAYKVRLMRELGDHVQQSGAAAVDVGYSPDAWDGIYRQIQNTRNKRAEQQGRNQPANLPVLNVGGAGRRAAMDVVHQPVKRLDPRFLQQNREFLLTLVAENKAIRQQHLTQIDLLKTELQNANLPAIRQQQLRDQLAISQSIVADIEAEIQALTQQLNGR